MLLEQCHDAPTHVASRVHREGGGLPLWRVLSRSAFLWRALGLRDSWSILVRLWWGRAGGIEKAVIPMLHVLEHLEQERFTFASSLRALSSFLQFFTEDLKLFA